MSYTHRRGPFLKPATWTLEPGVLIETREGRTRRWPLSDLRVARIAPGTNRYVPGETVLRLLFAKGGAGFGSHSFGGLALYVDQGAEFRAFVREVCVAARAAAPGARFEAGTAKREGVFTGAAAILGAGVLLLLMGATAAGAYALGAELASRLVFVLLLMFAVSPWLPGAKIRPFDPGNIPDEILAAHYPPARTKV